VFNYEYIGNLHVHSRHSDGTLSAPEIAGVAHYAGLDFVGVNDHDFMTDGLHLDEEGFYGNVLLLKGQEVGKRYHHYLIYDPKTMVHSDHGGPQDIIDRANEKGGFGFLAHPFEHGMPFLEKGVAYTWNDLSVQRFAGIEIWNYSSRWKERLRGPLTALLCLTFKRRTLHPPSSKTLAFWDRLCRERRVVGIGGSDAHGALVKWGLFHFRPLSYSFLLNTINVHIFLNRRMPRDFNEAKQEVYQALRMGRLFIAYDGLAPARGFRFNFVSHDGGDLVMGEESPFQPGEIVIELPSKGLIRLIRDGRVEGSWQGREVIHRVRKPGVYRVEVERKLRFTGYHPWIYTNPVYLR